MCLFLIILYVVLRKLTLQLHCIACAPCLFCLVTLLKSVNNLNRNFTIECFHSSTEVLNYRLTVGSGGGGGGGGELFACPYLLRFRRAHHETADRITGLSSRGRESLLI